MAYTVDQLLNNLQTRPRDYVVKMVQVSECKNCKKKVSQETDILMLENDNFNKEITIFGVGDYSDAK